MRAYYENRSYNSAVPVRLGISENLNFLAHWHNDIELVYVCDGSIRLGINKECRTLSRGDFAICSSGDIHYYDSKDLSSSVFILIFRPELLDNKGMWPYNARFDSPYYIALTENNNEISSSILSILLSMHEEMQDMKEFYNYIVKGLLFELCGIILRCLPTHSISLEKEYWGASSLRIIQKSIKFIEDNYKNDISQKSTADAVNISQFYFSRQFKAITNMNFSTYLNTIRIEKAEELILSDPRISLTDIAFECGFNSIRTFNRSFKFIKGYIPSSIR